MKGFDYIALGQVALVGLVLVYKGLFIFTIPGKELKTEILVSSQGRKQIRKN